MNCPALAVLCAIAARQLQAQEPKPWLLLVEAGTAEIHRASSDGWAAKVALARSLQSDYVRLRGDFGVSSADESLVVLAVGGELRLCGTRCPVAPFIAAGMGYLAEPEFNGAVLQVGGGIDFRIGINDLVRASVQRATHGARSGPHMLLVAFGHRFGKPRAGGSASR